MQKHIKVLGILSIALSAAASAALAYTHEEVLQKTVPAAGITKLSVSNVNGDVSVQPWDKPEMHIQAKKRVRHSSREMAEKYARQLEIAVATNGDVLEVRTVMPGQPADRDWLEWFFSLDWLFERRVREASVSYEISTPPRMDAKLVSTNGRVQIGAIEGRADLRTTNGAVHAEGTQGAVQAHTTNGAISLVQVAGGCNAVTTNGKITAELLSLGSQGCELHTTNGAIHITLPENVHADLEASTTNGSVTSALPLAVQGKISKQGMEGKINGGGPPLKLRTTNGSITIAKTEARETALPPPALSSMPSDAAVSGSQASVLRIQVWQHGEQQVKISVPLALAQEALRHLPDAARDQMRDQGVDIEQLLQAVAKNPKLGKLLEIQNADGRVEIGIE
jgi:hypothetical protein